MGRSPDGASREATALLWYDSSYMLPMGHSMDLNRIYRCVAELNQVMNRGVELSVLLETIARETALLLGADTTSVLLLDNHRERLVCSASQGLTPAERDAVQFRPGEGIAGWVVAHSSSAL